MGLFLIFSMANVLANVLKCLYVGCCCFLWVFCGGFSVFFVLFLFLVFFCEGGGFSFLLLEDIK